jgi:hypothetical protein
MQLGFRFQRTLCACVELSADWWANAVGISSVADSAAEFNGSARDILADHQTEPVICAGWSVVDPRDS